MEGISLHQVEVRRRGDGKFAQIDWKLAAATIDQTIAQTVVGRIKSMQAMVGYNTSSIDAIEQALAKL